MAKPARYPREQITILNLHDQRLAPYWGKLWDLITPLRPFTHFGENGVSPTGLRAWMDFHNFPLAGQTNPVYGSRIAIDETTGDVLGMGTLAPDDRGVGAEMKEEFGIEATGCWGGFYMFLQGVGIGGYVCDYVDAEIQSRVDKTGLTETWLLFTANPLAVQIYERLGFGLVKKNHFVKVFGNREDVYEKTYAPTTK
jgi:hypothetical protein